MSFSPDVWRQIKNITADDLISALKKDGWERDGEHGAILAFRHPTGKRITIHYHPRKTYGPKLLKDLLADIGWTVEDMRRIKLI